MLPWLQGEQQQLNNVVTEGELAWFFVNSQKA
jgi:hypothetical protein